MLLERSFQLLEFFQKKKIELTSYMQLSADAAPKDGSDSPFFVAFLLASTPSLSLESQCYPRTLLERDEGISIDYLRTDVRRFSSKEKTGAISQQDKELVSLGRFGRGSGGTSER